MTTTLTRLLDNAVLGVLGDDTMLVTPGEIFSYSRETDFTSGSIGESVAVASRIMQKDFTITFLSGDRTGVDQKAILRFFSKYSWYSLTDTDYGLVGFEFTVTDVASTFFEGRDLIEVTCRARYGDLVKKASSVLLTRPVAAGGTSAAWTGAFTNSMDDASSIQVEITAATSATFKANTSITLSASNYGSIRFLTGKFNSQGSLVTFTGTQLLLDSYSEVLGGFAAVSPLDSNFYRIPQGAASTISLSALANPFTTNVAYTVVVRAFTVVQES